MLPDGRLVGTFVGFLVPGTLLLLLFAVLIPAFWFVTVWRHRHQLEVSNSQGRRGGAVCRCQSGAGLVT